MKPSVLAFLVASLLPVHGSAQGSESAQETDIVIDDTAKTVFESTPDGALLQVSISKPGQKLDAKSTCIFFDDNTSPDNVPDRVEGAYTAAGADVEKKFGRFYRLTRDGLIGDYVQELVKIALRVHDGEVRAYAGVRSTRDVPNSYDRSVLEGIAKNNKTPFGTTSPFTLLVAEDALGNMYFAVASDEKRGTYWFFVDNERLMGDGTSINLYQPRDGTKAMIQGLGSTLKMLLVAPETELKLEGP